MTIRNFNGDAEMLGVDNGAPDNVQPYQSDTLVTSQGRALLIVRARIQAAKVTVTASSPGLKNGNAELHSAAE